MPFVLSFHSFIMLIPPTLRLSSRSIICYLELASPRPDDLRCKQLHRFCLTVFWITQIQRSILTVDTLHGATWTLGIATASNSTSYSNKTLTIIPFFFQWNSLSLNNHPFLYQTNFSSYLRYDEYEVLEQMDNQTCDFPPFLFSYFWMTSFDVRVHDKKRRNLVFLRKMGNLSISKS